MISRLRRARADLATMNRLFPHAERIAHDDAAERPGAEHLLLAAVELEDTTALDVLDELGMTANDLRSAIRQQHATALLSIGISADDTAIGEGLPAPQPAPRVYRAEGSLQHAFQRAVELAKEDGAELRTGHVLLAASETEHGTVARAFRQLGVDRDQLHALTRRRLAQASSSA